MSYNYRIQNPDMIVPTFKQMLKVVRLYPECIVTLSRTIGLNGSTIYTGKRFILSQKLTNKQRRFIKTNFKFTEAFLKAHPLTPYRKRLRNRKIVSRWSTWDQSRRNLFIQTKARGKQRMDNSFECYSKYAYQDYINMTINSLITKGCKDVYIG